MILPVAILRALPSCQLSTLLLGVCLTASLPARAGNDDEIFVGNQAAMTGGAVSATVSDSSATWYNPAGLGAVDLHQIDVSGTCYALRAYSAPRFIGSTTGQVDSASVVEFVSVPSQVALVRQLGPDMSLGLGYFVPQASNLLLRESLRFTQGELDSAWQVSLNQVRVQHTGAAGLGMRLSSRVRFGFSLVGTYQAETQSVSVVAAQSSSGAADLEQQRVLSSTVLGSSSRFGLELGVGFQIELARAWRLGVSARSARVILYQIAHVSGATVQAEAGDGTTPGMIAAEISDPSEQEVTFDVARAGRLNLALARSWGDGDWVAIEADVQPAIHDAGVGTERRAVFNARVGMYHRVTETLAVGIGAFSDRAPDPPPSDPISGAADFYGGSLGVEYSNRHRLREDRADSLSLSTTLALRYAFSSGRFNEPLVDPGEIGTLAAKSGPLIVHELGFYVGGGLSF